MRSIWIYLSFALLSGSIAHAQNFNSQSFQYLTGVLQAGSMVTPSSPGWNAQNPAKWYSMSVTSTASGFNVVLEDSLDNVNWTVVSSDTGFSQVSNTNPSPSLYFRLRAISLGSNAAVTATAIGVW